MSTPKLLLLILLTKLPCFLIAQEDTALHLLGRLPAKYFTGTEKKIGKYTSRLTNKTEKTLTRLSRWESRVQQLLQKVNPQAAERLFANEQLTFTDMLARYKKGQALIAGYKSSYDEHRDKLATQLQYIDSNKQFLSASRQRLLKKASEQSARLEKTEEQNEALQKIIRERKKQLVAEAIKHLGNTRQLQKINKETYYYLETVKNYKQLFNDKTKREETAKKLLEKIPGFNDFMQKNSKLAALFKMPENYGSPQSLAGLQTRSNVNALLQARIAAGGPNAIAEVKQNMQQAQAEISKLKDKVLKAGGSSDTELPDFKPNMQKTKTFFQRLEFSPTVQFGKKNKWVPGSADIGLNVGYKLNDRSVVGIGMAYMLGIGSLEKIKFTHEGIGLRSFIDWKLKKQFFISGGFEMNHNKSFKNIYELKDAWQQSGLIGISRKFSINTKKIKASKVQLLYDFLQQRNISHNPFIFRIGYDM